MLFDPRPKSSRKELFDRERELNMLDRLVERGDPLILVLGIRRIGKTSLLKSFLEKWYGIYIDMRGIFRESDLYERVSESLSSSKWKIKKFLENIRGVRIVGVEVRLKWRGKDSISLLGLLEEFNKFGERIVVVFDETQLVRPPISIEVKNTIAYTYDHLENITIILSGSEIGLLKNFVGVENRESPLYGRYAYELVVDRFSHDLSIEFLKQGFHEVGLDIGREVIEEAIDLFDGIVGWLVFFGRSYIDGMRNLESILDKAVNIALEELDKLSRNEKLVLKAIAYNSKSWSAVRRFIEEETGFTIPKSTLSRTIKKLEKLSIIENYEFLDPIYKQASKKLRI